MRIAHSRIKGLGVIGVRAGPRVPKGQQRDLAHFFNELAPADRGNCAGFPVLRKLARNPSEMGEKV